MELRKRVSALANYASEQMVQIPDNTAAGKEIARILGKALVSLPSPVLGNDGWRLVMAVTASGAGYTRAA